MPCPEITDFNKVCRMCLQEDSTLINIFFSDAADIIPKITTIQPREGDYLPENICISCMDNCIEFYKFKQVSERNNATLLSILALAEALQSKDSNIEENLIVQQEYQEKKFKSYIKKDKDTPLGHNTTQTEISNGQTHQHRKIEIRRNYMDLTPFETYIEKKSKTFTLTQTDGENSNNGIQHLECLSQDSLSECDYLEFKNEETGDIEKQGSEETGLVKDKLEVTGGKEWCVHCAAEFNDIETHSDVYHSADGLHYCHICSKMKSSTYKTVKQLQAHLKYHKRVPKFQCEQCERWFRFKHQKTIHMRSHTGERPAVCHICNKAFKDSRYLVVHLKSHTGERPYKCSICQKGFGHKFSLKVHMKTHTTEREHMCNICGKTFIYKHNLNIHLRQHSGEKPYTCNICFSSFISCSVLKGHMLTHSDQKRFECRACGKKFKRTGDLNVHMRSHTGERPYACTLCSNKYKMSSHLTEHMKTHTGEKNFVCEICPKSFYNNKSLQVHKETHTGKKTYTCQECDKSFVHHTSLCAHQRKKHRQ